MKFKDKNGNVFDNIAVARTAYCSSRPNIQISKCKGCPLGKKMNGDNLFCDLFVHKRPLKAAELMGMEAITDDGPDPRAVTRGSILAAARMCVCGDCEQDYGRPENNFQTIANLWIDYLNGKGEPLDIAPHDVAAMLALLKIARISSGHAKADNWIDLAGYAACGGVLEAEQ